MTLGITFIIIALFLLVLFCPPVSILMILPGLVLSAGLAWMSGELLITHVLLGMTVSIIPLGWALLGAIYQRSFFQRRMALFETYLPLLASFFLIREMMYGDLILAAAEISVSGDPKVVLTSLLHLTASSIRTICALGLGFSFVAFLYGCLARLTFPTNGLSSKYMFDVGAVPIALLLVTLSVEQMAEYCLRMLLA